MGPVKPVGQLYGSPTALKSQFPARDRYCKYVFQTPRVERRIFLDISGTNKTHRSTTTTRGRPVSNTEFTFCCVLKPNKRTYEE